MKPRPALDSSKPAIARSADVLGAVEHAQPVAGGLFPAFGRALLRETHFQEHAKFGDGRAEFVTGGAGEAAFAGEGAIEPRKQVVEASGDGCEFGGQVVFVEPRVKRLRADCGDAHGEVVERARAAAHGPASRQSAGQHEGKAHAADRERDGADRGIQRLARLRDEQADSGGGRQFARRKWRGPVLIGPFVIGEREELDGEYSACASGGERSINTAECGRLAFKPWLFRPRSNA